MKLHTKQSLYDEWNNVHKKLKKQQHQIEGKMRVAKTGDELARLENELDVVFEKINLISLFLSDIDRLIEH